MNYYRFLDSRDIRNHLEEMEYPLSTPEAAYLVWQCRGAILEERFAAWEEIIETMPDCTFTAMVNSILRQSNWTLPRCMASTTFCGSTSSGRRIASSLHSGRGRHLHPGEAGRPLDGR